MFKPLFKGHTPNWHKLYFRNKMNFLMKEKTPYVSILDRVLKK